MVVYTSLNYLHGLKHVNWFYWFSHHLQQWRGFFLLENSFSHQQRCSLEDYVSLSVLLQYNYH